MIFNLIGTPSDLDVSFITDDKALAYIKAFPYREPADLRQEYPEVNEEGLRLL